MLREEPAAGHASASATRAGRRTAGPATRTRTRTRSGRSRVVHNGIIENHVALRARARGRGARSSRRETDTEIVAHLVDERSSTAARATCADAVRARARAGARAPTRIVVMSDKQPGRRSSRRRTRRRWSSASARARTSSRPTSPAILAAHARGDLPRGGRDRRGHAQTASTITDLEGKPLEREPQDASRGRAVQAEKGGYQALHAQGDPRAAARGRPTRCAGASIVERDDVVPRRHRARRRRRSSGSCSSPAAPRTTRRWSASS